MSENVISCRHVAKRYREGGGEVVVLRDISLDVAAGAAIAIMGSSGSGKSTLLNLLGGLDAPDEGEILIRGTSMAQLPEKSCAAFRNRHIGFVYQLHHLLMEFTALENVMMPLLIRGASRQEASEAASNMLERVGLAQRLHHRPSALSGGERQRVAIARALVTRPSCVLMDEPTGNLDARTAATILGLIKELRESLQLAFVVVTHDLQLAQQIGTVYELKQGLLTLGNA